jgi:hypothetical protein
MDTVENNKLIAEYTVENNKLIAEFMGLNIDKGVQSDYMEHELKYHKEWNWLMPVVESVFERLDARDTSANEIKRHLLTCNRKAIHKSVVEFIKFYNENTTP